MPTDSLFATARTNVIEAYKKAGQSFLANTKPYKSKATFLWNYSGSFNATAGDPTNGYLICRKGQVVEWFSYGLGDIVAGSNAGDAILTADENDTNLAKGRSTNGAEDFVIESISATLSDIRQKATGTVPGTTDDPDLQLLAQGKVPFLDPAAIITPPQLMSPFNLESALMSALAPNVSIEFEWDRGRIIKVGTLDQIPEGGAKSFLRANGDPRTDDRYKIPEGYVWRRDGQPDSEFIVRGTVRRSVVIPVTLALPPGAENHILPTFVFTDIVLRLHGLGVRLPSGN
jgi:hypothetical protein